MSSGLEHLLAEGVISEVLARLKSGKEADVYVVRFGGNVVAAKVYKDRSQRSFKNNSAYKEGRSVRSSRSQRAIDKKSRFGQAAAEDAWKSAEADALYKLHAANVRVPTPVVFLDGILLMELVLDAHGEAAPRLIDTHLTVAEANAAYRDMLGQIVRILACDLIHGDLSPYNVLWAAAGPTIIDFPQTISASHNSSSEAFFLRDARNILGYFAGIDRSLHARSGDPAEIWRAYLRRELTPDFLPAGRPPPREHREQREHREPHREHREPHREQHREQRVAVHEAPPRAPRVVVHDAPQRHRPKHSPVVVVHAHRPRPPAPHAQVSAPGGPTRDGRAATAPESAPTTSTPTAPRRRRRRRRRS